MGCSYVKAILRRSRRGPGPRANRPPRGGDMGAGLQLPRGTGARRPGARHGARGGAPRHQRGPPPRRRAVAVRDCAAGRERDQRRHTMTQPMATKADEAEARWWFASLTKITCTAEDTGGLLSIVDITQPPGTQAPLRVHHREDEGL